MNPPPRDNQRAILTMLVGVGFFSLMDAGLKLLSARYPPFEVAALRSAASLPLVLTWAFATVGWKSLLRVRWSLHLLRAAIGVSMMSAFIYALQKMPLSSAYAIFFVAPLLITVLSVPFLGEQVGPRRWAAIAIGFVGVLVALRPNGEGMVGAAGLAALFAALGYAVPRDHGARARAHRQHPVDGDLAVPCLCHRWRWRVRVSRLGDDRVFGRLADRRGGHYGRAGPVHDYRSLHPRRGLGARTARDTPPSLTWSLTSPFGMFCPVRQFGPARRSSSRADCTCCATNACMWKPSIPEPGVHTDWPHARQPLRSVRCVLHNIKSPCFFLSSAQFSYC